MNKLIRQSYYTGEIKNLHNFFGNKRMHSSYNSSFQCIDLVHFDFDIMSTSKILRYYLINKISFMRCIMYQNVIL